MMDAAGSARLGSARQGMAGLGEAGEGELSIGALVERFPGLGDTVANLVGGYSVLTGHIVELWLDEHTKIECDRLFSDEADGGDVCRWCSAHMLEGLATHTCSGCYCPGCWDDFGVPCHRECWE